MKEYLKYFSDAESIGKIFYTFFVALKSLLFILILLGLIVNLYATGLTVRYYPFSNHLGNVVIISDLHYPYGGKNVQMVIEEILKIKPKYVFMLGDLTEMGQENEFISLNNLLNVLEREKINYEKLLGNHDVRWSFKVRKTKVINKGLYECFRRDLEDIAFIGIDTSLYFQHFGHIGDGQLKWLKVQLEEAEKSGKDIVVFSHHPFAGPVNYTDDGWKVEEIINKLNNAVRVVLYGHLHTLERLGLHNNIWFQSVGAAKDGWFIVLSWDKSNFYLWRGKTIKNLESDIKLIKTVPRRMKVKDAEKIVENEIKVQQQKSQPLEPFEEIFQYKMENSIFSQPVFLNDSIVAIDYSGNIISFSTNGKIKWKKRINNSVVSNLEAWKNLIIAGDLEGNLYTIDYSTGMIEKRMKFNGPIFSMKVVNEIMLAGVGKDLYVVNMPEFKIIANHDLKGLIQVPAAYKNGLFFQTSWGGDIYVVNKVGKIIWKIKAGSGYYTPGANVPVVVNGYIFVVNPFGGFQAFNYDSLEYTTNETKNLEVRGLKSGYTSVILLNEKPMEFLICGIDGTVSIVEIQGLGNFNVSNASKEKPIGTIKAQIKVSSPIYGSTPQIISNGTGEKFLLGTTKGELVILKRDINLHNNNLKLLLKRKLHNSYILLPIIVKNERLVITFTDGTIKIFRIDYSKIF